jgi:proton glutamate symport protein
MRKFGTKSLLQHPIVIFASLFAGLAVGIYFPTFGTSLEPFGNMYLKVLEFTLVPIIAASVILSISKLLGEEKKHHNARELLAIIFLFMILIGAISLTISFLLKPASTLLTSSNFKLHEISSAASIIKRNLADAIEAPFTKPVSQFILDAIPNNLFLSLQQSKIVQILVMSCILGIAMGFLPREKKESTHRFFEITLQIFQDIISYITIWLPLGIFCLMASSTSIVGFDTIKEMGPVLFKAYLVFIAIFIICMFIIKFRARCTLFETLYFLKVPIFVAFGTRSSIAAIPSQMESLKTNFRFDSNTVNLLVPLGAIIGRFGNIAYFGFLTVFVMQLYLFEPSLYQCVMIVLLLAVAGLSTTGASGIATLGILTIVLDPLNMPIGAIMPLLIAVDTLIDPMRTLSTVYTNCANIALSAPRPHKHDQ